jgi:dienelactone hydrolase
MFLIALFGIAAASLAAEHPRDLLLSDKSLDTAPATHAASDIQAPAGVQALFFDAKPFAGKPTRVFAFMGVPKTDAGKTVPGIVLIHGGGGTAFAEWVKLWNDRGYAAIAMDTCGTIPVKDADGKSWKRHEHSGPAGWDASFTQLDAPLTDQWQYHALSAIKLSHSLLRAQKGVDRDRVGVTGISWGGYLTCLVVGVDHRYKFAVPVYGCGFIDECVWQPALDKMQPEKKRQWLDSWDPRHYLKDAPVPMLWLNGTNDFAYPMGAMQKSYRLPKSERLLSITLRMPHGHPPGQTPEIIRAYADSFFFDKPTLPKITAQGRDGETLWATFTAKTAVSKAQILWTADEGPWQKRTWEAGEAKVGDDYRVTAKIPAGAKVGYLNLIDERGLTVSTEHEELAN